MKIIFKSIVLTAVLFAGACSKDTADEASKVIEQEIEQLEKMPLASNTESDNVMIAGATREEGVPPTPYEAISLDLSESGTTAFLNEGFEIALNSEANIVGALLQFKNNDGTIADRYHDINNALKSKRSSAKVSNPDNSVRVFLFLLILFATIAQKDIYATCLRRYLLYEKSPSRGRIGIRKGRSTHWCRNRY